MGTATTLVFAGAFLVGLALGAEVDLLTYLVSRYFGLRSFGKLYSFAFGAFVLAGALGPLATGVLQVYVSNDGCYSSSCKECGISSLCALQALPELPALL
jgi:MFS family permease